MNFWIKDLATGLKIMREAKDWSEIKRWVTTEWGWQGGSYLVVGSDEAWARNFKGRLDGGHERWIRVIQDSTKPGPKPKFSTPCKRRSVSLPQHYWDSLDAIAKNGYEGSVSAAIRDAINEKFGSF